MSDPLIQSTQTLLRRITLPLILLSGVLGVWALYHAFIVAPDERMMGAVQRIFYFHVGSAIAGYFGFCIVLGGALGVLATPAESAKRRFFDAVQASGAETALLFCSITLASGMIWGHAAWNTWFRFEPRLVTFLLLWLIAFMLVLMRSWAESGKVAGQAAVLGILGAAMVPVVVYSVKILSAAQQLHPVVVEHGGLKDPRYGIALGIATLALIVFAGAISCLGLRTHLVKDHGNS